MREEIRNKAAELHDEALKNVSGGNSGMGWRCESCKKASTYSKVVSAGNKCPYCGSKRLIPSGSDWVSILP